MQEQMAIGPVKAKPKSTYHSSILSPLTGTMNGPRIQFPKPIPTTVDLKLLKHNLAACLKLKLN